MAHGEPNGWQPVQTQTTPTKRNNERNTAMTYQLFDKIEGLFKPTWNGLTVPERESLSRTAKEFQDWKKARESGEYDPGADPYEMNPEAWLRDCLLYHIRMAVIMGQRLKKFKALTPHDRTVEALFANP